MSIVVAMARNRVIGANGRIPWRLPEEQQLFKRITMGHHLVMGRKTYDSIGRLLPGRTTIIVTRQRDFRVPGALVAHSLDEALALAATDSEVFVIGGAEIIREALPIADRLHLTVVGAEPEGDVLMPEVDLSAWRVVERAEHAAFVYTVYERA